MPSPFANVTVEEGYFQVQTGVVAKINSHTRYTNVQDFTNATVVGIGGGGGGGTTFSGPLECDTGQLITGYSGVYITQGNAAGTWIQIGNDAAGPLAFGQVKVRGALVDILGSTSVQIGGGQMLWEINGELCQNSSNTSYTNEGFVSRLVEGNYTNTVLGACLISGDQAVTVTGNQLFLGSVSDVEVNAAVSLLVSGGQLVFKSDGDVTISGVSNVGISSQNGNITFTSSSDDIFLTSDEVTVSGTNGATLRSTNGSIIITGEQGIAIASNNGPITVSTQDFISLAGGDIDISSSNSTVTVSGQNTVYVRSSNGGVEIAGTDHLLAQSNGDVIMESLNGSVTITGYSFVGDNKLVLDNGGIEMTSENQIFISGSNTVHINSNSSLDLLGTSFIQVISPNIVFQTSNWGFNSNGYENDVLYLKLVGEITTGPKTNIWEQEWTGWTALNSCSFVSYNSSAGTLTFNATTLYEIEYDISFNDSGGGQFNIYLRPPGDIDPGNFLDSNVTYLNGSADIAQRSFGRLLHDATLGAVRQLAGGVPGSDVLGDNGRTSLIRVRRLIF